ncbi:MAG: hypothetical protein HKN16_02410 [Saprospiraceae bacterium]|nr:hypothetical protein [Saprospiraceae bacterium]
MKYPMFLILTCLIACEAPVAPASKESNVIRYDRPDASILKGASVPAGKQLFFSSGQVTNPVYPDAPEKSLQRYGNTYEQSIGTLQKLEGVLKEAGLGLDDVVYLGVFIAPDPREEDQIDFDAWFRAYGEFFNNEENPVKTARSTIGVAALARPYLLVEVEAIAAYD